MGTGTGWVGVAGGGRHSLAVRADGTLWAWGNNGIGQVGDGTTTDRYLPSQVGSSTAWVSAAGGYFHSLAVRADGTLWAGATTVAACSAMAPPPTAAYPFRWAAAPTG